MILTEKLVIKLTGTQGNYYNNLGYNCKNGDVIEIHVKDMPKGSHTKINVKCDICGKEKELIYKQYNKNISKYNLYSCSEKCANFKNRATCVEKYGSETYNNRDSAKETCIEKYGVDSPNKLDSKKIKAKNTCLKRYGTKSPTENKEILDKVKKTNLERYGYDNVAQVEKFKEKSKKTCLEKYDHDYHLGSEIFRTKMINNYGVDNPLKSNFIKEKIKNKFSEKYGFDYFTQTDLFKDKSKETRIKNGNQTPDDLKSKYQLYRQKVDLLTNKIRKELFENWNGYDYYDNEFIKENLKLNYKNKLYPSIDHKISVYYGLINNIPPEEIAKLDNLCITKRYINSSKREMNEKDFELKWFN